MTLTVATAKARCVRSAGNSNPSPQRTRFKCDKTAISSNISGSDASGYFNVAKIATFAYNLSMSVVPKSELIERRLKKFHEDCVEACSSRKRFEATFEVDQKHILKNALLKQNERMPLLDTAAI